jgi:hypothetical protein
MKIRHAVIGVRREDREDVVLGDRAGGEDEDERDGGRGGA